MQKAADMFIIRRFVPLLMIPIGLVAGGYVLNRIDEPSKDISVVTNIDTIIWDPDYVFTPESPNRFVTPIGNEGKDMDALLKLTSEVRAPVKTDGLTAQVSLPLSGIYALNRRFDHSSSYLSIYYDAKTEEVSFTIPSYSLSIGAKLIDTAPQVLYTLRDIPPNSIIVFSNGPAVFLDSYQNDAEIRLADLLNSRIDLYSKVNDNLLSDEKTFSEKENVILNVMDCSNTLPGDPSFSASLLSDDILRGGTGYRIRSSNHFACVKDTHQVNINLESLYVLRFNFRTVAGNLMRYYFRLIGQSDDGYSTIGHSMLKTITTNNDEWQTHSEIISPHSLRVNTIRPDMAVASPADDIEGGVIQNASDILLQDISHLDVFFYAPSDGSREIITDYSNLRLEEYRHSRMITLPIQIEAPSALLAKDIHLTADTASLSLIDSKNNLLEHRSASFEDGSWGSNVNDCSTWLSGTPEMQMSLVNEATDGRSGLQLSSNNHYACASKQFPIELSAGSYYALSFDYKNVVGDSIQAYYRLTGTNQTQFKSLKKQVQPGQWFTFRTLVTPEIEGINSMDIFLYAPSRGKFPIVNIYDNLILVQSVPKDIASYYFTLANPTVSPKIGAEVESSRVNRWERDVLIRKAKQPFLLVLEEPFDSNWKAYVSQSADIGQLSVGAGWKPLTRWFNEPLGNHHHYRLNNYENAWYFDPQNSCGTAPCLLNEDGTYDIQLTVVKSDILYIRDAMVFIACLSFFALIINLLKRRRRS